MRKRPVFLVFSALVAVVAALLGFAGGASAAGAAGAAAPAPLVRGFAPTVGPTGTVVTVTGRYFMGATAVTVGGVSSSFVVVDDRTLTVTVAPAAVTGSVAVTTPSGSSALGTFNVDARTVRGFSPTSGPPGTVVVLNGINFLGTAAVRFAGVLSPAFTVIDDRTIYAQVPFGAGIGPITVVEGPAVGTSLPFTFDPVTVIRGFAPTSGGPGTEVTINGRNFTGATGVDFAGTPAYSVVVVSNTQIRAVVPYGAAPGQIVVHGVGNDATSGQVAFEVRTQLPVQFPLASSRLGAGSGVVASAPAGISCGSSCAATFAFLTVVTLTATADPGSVFGGWTGDCAFAAGAVCTVELSRARAAAAIFIPAIQPLTVGRTGSGGGTVASAPAGIFCGAVCTTDFADGTVVTLTATPDAGSSFAGWAGACTGSGACTVAMTTPRSVTATFVEDVYPLTVTRSGPGVVASAPAGIFCGAACSASFSSGTVVTLTATPDAAASFVGWSGACTGSASSCTVTLSVARAVTATFVDRFPLTVSRLGTGSGTVTSAPTGIFCGAACSASYDAGTTVTLTATPDASSTFAGWSGACTGAGACTVTVDAAKTVSATFTRTTYPITVSRSGPGTVTSAPAGIYCGASCSATYDEGTVVTLTATPDAGAVFAGWSGACTGAGVTCTVTMSVARAVTATFTRSFALSVVRAGTGSGSVTSTPAGISCGTDCSASYLDGTAVTLSAAATVGSAFAGWSGACTGTGECIVTMDAARVVAATFTRVTFGLTASRNGSGSGTVTSSPTGIYCGAVCVATYDEGTLVTLTATPDATSSFAGWAGACSGTGACSVVMDSATSVTATFTRNTFGLVVARWGPGTVTSSPFGIYCGAACSATYDEGTVVTLTATPDATASFVGWSGACTGAAPTCTVTMDAARSVTATFEVNSYALTVSRLGSGSGTVTSSPAAISCGAICAASFAAGSVVVLTATPDASSAFVGWSGACSGASFCVLSVDAATSVSATFVENSYTLSTSRLGSGSGTVASAPAGIFCGAICAASYVHGSVVTLTATPDASSSFVGWTGACTGTGSCTVTIDAAKFVAATFVGNTYGLSVSRTGAGSGAVTSSPAGIDCGATCTATYDQGSTVTLTATPDSTSSFLGWSGACTGSSTTCTLTMNAARSVTATFTRNAFALTVTRSGAGVVTSSPSGIYCGAACSASFDAGTVVTLTATPDATSSFAGWSGACSGTGTCTVTMNAASSVSATFVVTTFTVSVSRAGTGSGTVTSSPAGISCGASCAAAFTSGSLLVLTATPDASSSFVGWSGACSGASFCVLTVDAAKAVTATFMVNAYPLSVSRTGTGSGTVTSSPAGISCGAACSASFTQGTLVTLTATADATSSFAGWSGACSGTGSCAVTVDAAKSVTATFTRTTFTLTVTRSGPGTVTSAPLGIYCGAACSASYDAGTSVTLTASPDSGATFTGWSGACSGTGTCTMTVTAATSVTATFATSSFTLSVSRTGTGSGTVTSSSPAGISCGATCSASFAGGTLVTLAATPDASSTFAGWSGACTGTGSCIVTMDAAKSVTATFMASSFAVSVTALGSTVTSAPGVINCGATCTDSYPSGTVVTLTATPFAGAVFTGWVGCDSSVGTTCTVTVASARSIIAKAGYDVAVSLAGAGTGTVTSSVAGISCSPQCVGNYAPGTVVILTATPSGGSSFAGWSGACTGTGTCTLTVDSVKTVSATFTGQTFALSVSGPGGTVTSSPAGISCGATCAATYSSGTTVTLTATPPSGGSIASWAGCDAVSGPICTVTMSSARSVSATFTFPLTVSRAGTGNGTVTSSPAGISCGVTCSAAFASGAAVTLTATPFVGSTFAGWSGACSGTGTCIVSVNAAISVTATFTEITFTLSVSRTGNAAGSVSSAPAGISCGVTCTAAFGSGSTVTLTAAGASVGSWAGCDSVSGATCTVTVAASRSVTVNFL